MQQSSSSSIHISLTVCIHVYEINCGALMYQHKINSNISTSWVTLLEFKAFLDELIKKKAQ